MNLSSNVVGLASEGYPLYNRNVEFVLLRQGLKVKPHPPYKTEVNVRIRHLYFGTIHSLDLPVFPCFK
jgi:hypothetical protein